MPEQPDFHLQLDSFSPLPEQSPEAKFSALQRELATVGDVHVLDDAPGKKPCVGFRHYHSSPNELPLFDMQPDRLALFNEHQDRVFDGLIALLNTYGPRGLRVICEHFNQPVEGYRTNLARVWRVDQARLADTHGIRGKLAAALQAGGPSRMSVLQDRCGDIRFAAYCLNAGMPQVILQGQPTGYQAESFISDNAKATIVANAQRTPSDEEILQWIAAWKLNEEQDEALRHGFVRQQAEQSGPEGAVGIVYGGAHWETGIRGDAGPRQSLESYLTAFRRVVVEPASYPALLPERIQRTNPVHSRFSQLKVANVRMLLEGVRRGAL